MVHFFTSVFLLIIGMSISCGVSVLDQDEVMSRSPRGGKDDALVNSALMRSLDQIDKYLNDLNVYYSVLGRPRFGKRSFQDGRKGSDIINNLKQLLEQIAVQRTEGSVIV